MLTIKAGPSHSVVTLTDLATSQVVDLFELAERGNESFALLLALQLVTLSGGGTPLVTVEFSMAGTAYGDLRDLAAPLTLAAADLNDIVQALNGARGPVRYARFTMSGHTGASQAVIHLFNAVAQ